MMYFKNVSCILLSLSVAAIGLTEADEQFARNLKKKNKNKNKNKKKNNVCRVDPDMTPVQMRMAETMMLEIRGIGTGMASKPQREPVVMPDFLLPFDGSDEENDGRRELFGLGGQCGLFNLSCQVCRLCQTVVPPLEATGRGLTTGARVACSAACIGIVELSGGGPFNPIADAVAFSCPRLCSTIFSFPAGQVDPGQVCDIANLC